MILTKFFYYEYIYNFMLPLKSSKKKYKKAKLTQYAGVSGKTKKFDQNLCNKYDIEARNTVKYILKDAVKDNENIYGEDLIFTTDKVPFKYLELQVESSWNTENFPYLYPFVYARKMKFSNDTLFIIFNKEMTELLMFSKCSIDKEPSKLKKYARENVHYVSWNKTLRIQTPNLSIDIIRTYCGLD